eukprot:Pgem_evm2s18446
MSIIAENLQSQPEYFIRSGFENATYSGSNDITNDCNTSYDWDNDNSTVMYDDDDDDDDFEFDNFGFGRFIDSETERYSYIKALNSGGFGDVFLVADEENNGLVCAMKVMNYQKVSVDDSIFEARFCTGLQHPNVITTYDWFVTNNETFIIQEYCSGGDLFDVITPLDGIEDEARVKKYFKQICEGVSYLHSKDLVHKDLKAENIMLTGDDDIRLIDFGLSGWADDEVDPLVGTIPYMAPEVYRRLGASTDGKAADIWALGVLLYVMIVGSNPWDAPSPHDPEFKRFNKENQFTDYQWSPKLHELFNKLFKSSPSKRITVDEIFEYFDYNWFAEDEWHTTQGSRVLLDDGRTFGVYTEENLNDDELVKPALSESWGHDILFVDPNNISTTSGSESDVDTSFSSSTYKPKLTKRKSKVFKRRSAHNLNDEDIESFAQFKITITPDDSEAEDNDDFENESDVGLSDSSSDLNLIFDSDYSDANEQQQEVPKFLAIPNNNNNQIVDNGTAYLKKQKIKAMKRRSKAMKINYMGQQPRNTPRWSFKGDSFLSDEEGGEFDSKTIHSLRKTLHEFDFKENNDMADDEEDFQFSFSDKVDKVKSDGLSWGDMFDEDDSGATQNSVQNSNNGLVTSTDLGDLTDSESDEGVKISSIIPKSASKYDSGSGKHSKQNSSNKNELRVMMAA